MGHLGVWKVLKALCARRRATPGSSHDGIGEVGLSVLQQLNFNFSYYAPDARCSSPTRLVAAVAAAAVAAVLDGLEAVAASRASQRLHTWCARDAAVHCAAVCGSISPV